MFKKIKKIFKKEKEIDKEIKEELEKIKEFEEVHEKVEETIKKLEEEKTEFEDLKEKVQELDKKLEEEKANEVFEKLEKEKEIRETETKIMAEKELVEKKENELEERAKKKGIFGSLKEKLFRSVSKDGLFGKIKTLFSGRSIIDEEMYEELEDLLIQSDIGMDMTLKIVKKLEEKVKELKIKEPEKVYDILKEVMKEFLIREDTELKLDRKGLNVILVVGVNGVGKTTTIGKLASKFVKEGKKVVIGAGDTFRAAAIEQLEEWAKRANAEIIKHSQGADPGAVVFDTLKAAENREADIAIIDTAGRLHNKNNLMVELEKINKIIKKHLGEGVFYESLLVIDGTTGQNGLTQAKVFNEVTDLTGFVVTKLDGTAKGGIIFSVSEEIKKPIKFIGVGEGIEDLRKFNVDEYINAIFE
ncbi:fused signal recognition particle receptor [Hypnocyclicus thermotrophus]|uniref:Signal recognition particle receptor FtsY n=1 Tax=Hypnocyclicus thermotrophus TaxID=1627895 RepID=A0AA46I5M6_9FUSO|nr:signal recognition particle-docking protein FtsY [Hypnocyclicus thermotrophus]TDT70493.1 fused signal recognition particle receptor [Hypnocyclicus thermotrophus]